MRDVRVHAKLKNPSLFGKTRVAPVKALSIPELSLWTGRLRTIGLVKTATRELTRPTVKLAPVLSSSVPEDVATQLSA